MDYDNNPQTSVHSQPGSGMTIAAVILGILSLVTFCFPYITIPAGATGIILALLSKGYEHHLSSRGKLGLGLSIAGLSVSILFIVFTLFLFTTDTQTNQMMRDYFNYYNEGGGSTSPNTQDAPYGSGDIEDWLKDYMNGSGGSNGGSMPQVKPYGSQDSTPGSNPAI